MALIDAAKDVFPIFLNSLATEVLPFYAKLAKEGFDFDRILWVRKGLSPYNLLSAGNLKSALSRWANDFHTGGTIWLLDEALRTLRFWYVAPEKQRVLAWFEMHLVSRTASTGEPLRFECEGWETELLTWTRYSQYAREGFEQQLLHYENQTRKLAESRGLVRARKKYSPENLEWFVLYQFAGLSSTEIAKHPKYVNRADESTILKGIKAAARLIGWNELRALRGRPNRKIQ